MPALRSGVREPEGDRPALPRAGGDGGGGQHLEGHFGGADRARLAGFLADKAADFTVLGEGEAVGPLFGEVARIPTVFVFDRAGRPVLHFIHREGARKTHVTGEELEAAVEQALEASG